MEGNGHRHEEAKIDKFDDSANSQNIPMMEHHLNHSRANLLELENRLRKNILDQDLSADELERRRWIVEHEKMHVKHQGHEQMHVEMLLILLVVLALAQVLLFQWKKHKPRSFQLATLIGMWLIPVAICVKNGWWRFIIIWLVFSILTGLVMRKARRKPIACTTPRLVYKWFYFLYTLSYVLGLCGYLIMMMTFFGLNLLFGAKPSTWLDCGVQLIFYGLYYGVLGRDLAESCADRMASTVGYYSSNGMTTRQLQSNICAVCGNPILVQNNEDAIVERTYKLSCNHIFHEFCVRGWCIIGKKQTCPYCKEKVDLKRMFCNPWERPHILYGQLLDWIRYLLAWQPVILTLVQGINWTLGLE